MFVSTKDQEINVYRVVVEVPGDESVGIFGTTFQVVFDDGYIIENKDDYNLLVSEAKNLASNLYGEKVKVYLFDIDDNQVWM